MKPDPASKVAGLLYCHICGGVIVLKAAELNEYATEGWPACCDEEMALYKPDGGEGQAGGSASIFRE